MTSVPDRRGVVAEPEWVRRVSDREGQQKLQQIVRRGSTSSVRYHRALRLLAMNYVGRDTACVCEGHKLS
ncbi:hypothetical protein GCM10022403_078860 [Streptomyces coacervatus]|uniref:Transposase n=1 Tax=Streptomyces coacervatus TaxID=647381 RepID=A0ABP7J5D1_9ACTN